MGYIEDIRSLAADAFFTLPLLIIGFIFFLGTLTSNVGLLLLFVGHLFIAPALSFLANETGLPWMDNDGKISIIKKAIPWLFSAILVLGIQGKSLEQYPYGPTALLVYIIPFFGMLIHYVFNEDKENKKSFFSFLNIVEYIWGSPKHKENAASTCGMIPGSKDQYFSPSDWSTHLTFFIGFVIANAITIFQQPAPIIKPSDPERQQSLDDRVNNRKFLSAFIIAVSIITFIILILFRFNKTPCESTIAYSATPLILIGLTGAAWFQVIYTSCGINPTDVLGIVQGMISPAMADNPIVCVGSKS